MLSVDRDKTITLYPNAANWLKINTRRDTIKRERWSIQKKLKFDYAYKCLFIIEYYAFVKGFSVVYSKPSFGQC